MKMIAHQSVTDKLPVVALARALERAEESVLPTARRIYGFLWNERLSHRDLLKGLHGIAQRMVWRYEADHSHSVTF
ncbi:MAG: hypothetical protein U9R48_11450 [Chloroflexota bacterium]|nr:hypothetical protein [Chloroflexota bacterium]